MKTILTPSGHHYGKRATQFRKLYIPRKDDTDVIQFLIEAKARGENITQLITEALRAYIQALRK